MPKLSRKKEALLRDTLNKFPTYTDVKIGKQLSLQQQTVAKYRKETDMRYDAEFISIVAGKFIGAFGKASDYWLQQISELEELKEGLEPMDILAICKQQADLQAKILFLAAQGEVKEVIRVMRSGDIPVLN